MSISILTFHYPLRRISVAPDRADPISAVLTHHPDRNSGVEEDVVGVARAYPTDAPLLLVGDAA